MSESDKTIQRVRYPKQWFVMHHLEPSEIDRLLQQENEQRKSRRLRLFEYFIPYLFLPHAEADEYAKDVEEQRWRAEENNDLRRILRSYVFIKASDREMARLVRRDWNRYSRLQLFFSNNHDGSHVIMPERHMRQFITTCCEKRQRFTFGPPVVDIHKNDVVIIKRGAFEDSEAVVLDAQQTAGGISLTLGIPFFCGEKTLHLKDMTPDDIHLPRTVETLLNNRFIDNVEQQVLTVLYHRMKADQSAAPAGAETDEEILNQVYHYSYVQMSDTPSCIRFRCLLLLCATLRLDVEGRTAIATELQTLLTATPQPDEAHQALLRAALYVATADNDYRTAAKAYWQSHRDVLPTLSSLMPLVTRLNCRFFKRHKVL